MLRPTIYRLWESPTLTTWGSFAVRSLTLVTVLPMVLRRLSPTDFSVWSMFAVIISLQGVAELGFGVTFARVIAYAMGGANSLERLGGGRPQKAEPNWDLMARILATMRTIYARLGSVVAAALVLGGTAIIARPILRTNTPERAWIAWGIVVIVTLYTFRCNQFSTFLQGTNHIALLRRWESLFSFASIVSMFFVLSIGGGLLSLVLAHQAWVALGSLRNAWLARRILDGRFAKYPHGGWDPSVYAAVWPSAWRSGIGSAMSFGLVQVSGLFHAQSNDIASVNGYLLALRLLQAISQFSQAPFYSKLPVMARSYAEGDRARMVALAKRGMTFSYWSFVVPASILALAGPFVLNMLGSSVPFPSVWLWLLLCGGMLIERYGAMHLQIYSTTNHIIWHVANGITGLIMVALWMILYRRFGALGLAAGMFGAYASFFGWFCAMRAHRAFNLPFPQYDFGTIGAPLAFFIGIGGIAAIWEKSF